MNCGCSDVAAPLAVSAKRVTDKERRDESRFARPLEHFQLENAPGGDFEAATDRSFARPHASGRQGGPFLYVCPVSDEETRRLWGRKPIRLYAAYIAVAERSAFPPRPHASPRSDGRSGMTGFRTRHAIRRSFVGGGPPAREQARKHVRLDHIFRIPWG